VIKKGRQLACQCLPLIDCTIKVRQEDGASAQFSPKRVKAKLIKTTDITHDIREFQFQSAFPAEFIAGQYAMLKVPGVSGERAYSMSNLPNEEGIWSFMIRRVPNGQGTKILFDSLKLNDEIEIDGPFGKAYFRSDSERNIVCVAGGSGLAPMLSIARAWSHQGKANNQHLTFSMEVVSHVISVVSRCFKNCLNLTSNFSLFRAFQCSMLILVKHGKGELGLFMML